MNSNELLDALKKQLGVESDYALARLLKISRPALSDWRERGLSDERALQFATDLHLDPGPILAAIHAERSSDPKVRKAWETIAKTIRSAAAAVLVVMGLGVTAPEPLQASVSTVDVIHYAKYRMRRLRAILRALAGGFGFSRYTLTPGGRRINMRGLAFFSLLALAGCGSESAQDNHGYGYHYDEIGSTGLRVRYDGHPAPTLAQIETLYTETKTCMGVTGNAPLVIFEHGTFGPNAVYGQTFLDSGTVLISSLLDPDPLLSYWTYKHEFVHHLLHQSGFVPARNAAHDSPLFNACTQPPL